MINGIKPSELEFRNKSLSIHLDKLVEIEEGPNPNISTFNINFQSVIRKRKFNHVHLFFLYR